MLEGPMFIDAKEIARAFGLSRTTVWRYAKRPDFPASYQFSASKVAWQRTEVVEWFMSQRRETLPRAR